MKLKYLISLLVSLVFTRCGNTKSEEEIFLERVGKQVIVNHDTLVIVNTSGADYILSNGLEIHHRNINMFLLHKEPEPKQTNNNNDPLYYILIQ